MKDKKIIFVKDSDLIDIAKKLKEDEKEAVKELKKVMEHQNEIKHKKN